MKFQVIITRKKKNDWYDIGDVYWVEDFQGVAYHVVDSEFTTLYISKSHAKHYRKIKISKLVKDL